MISWLNNLQLDIGLVSIAGIVFAMVSFFIIYYIGLFISCYIEKKVYDYAEKEVHESYPDPEPVIWERYEWEEILDNPEVYNG